MRTAIAYYSMSGNTKYVADKIAGELKDSDEVDIIRIDPEKAYPDKGARKFFWGGKSAVMGEKPKVQPYEFEAEQYDRIIIGTPVWAAALHRQSEPLYMRTRIFRERKLLSLHAFVEVVRIRQSVE